MKRRKGNTQTENESLPRGMYTVPLPPREVAVENGIKLAQEVLKRPCSPQLRATWERWLKELEDEKKLGSDRYEELQREIRHKLRKASIQGFVAGGIVLSALWALLSYLV